MPPKSKPKAPPKPSKPSVGDAGDVTGFAEATETRSQGVTPGFISPDGISPPISPGAASSAVGSPGVTTLGATSPGVTSPGVMSPGVMSPGVMSPAVADIGAVSPGAKSPGVPSPGTKTRAPISPEVKGPGIASPGAVSPGPTTLSPGLKVKTSRFGSPSVASPKAPTSPATVSTKHPFVLPQPSPAAIARRRARLQKNTKRCLVSSVLAVVLMSGIWLFFMRNTIVDIIPLPEPSRTVMGNFTTWASIGHRLCANVSRQELVDHEDE